MGLPAIGLGISAIGQIGGALSSNSANNRNRDAVQAQQMYMRQLLGPMLQRDPGAAERFLAGNLGLFSPQGDQFTAQPYDAAQVGMPSIDATGILEAFNVGQDGIMQAINSDPLGDTGALIPNLEGILSNGNPFDTTQLMEALQPTDDYQFNRAIAELRGGAGSLGQRFGTALGQRENDLITQLTQAQNLRNAQIAQSGFESAQGRRLQAGQILSQLYQNRGQQGLQALGLGLDRARGIADFLTGQQALEAQLGLANAGALNEASQFNQQLGLNAFQTNQTARLNELAQLLQAAQLMGGLTNQRIGTNASLASILAGGPIPQSQPNALGGVIGDLGQSAALLPFMYQMLGNRPVTRAA